MDIILSLLCFSIVWIMLSTVVGGLIYIFYTPPYWTTDLECLIYYVLLCVFWPICLIIMLFGLVIDERW